VARADRSESAFDSFFTVTFGTLLVRGGEQPGA